MSSIQYKSYDNKFSFRNKLVRLLWNITYRVTFKLFQGPLFNSFRILVLRIFGAKIGYKCKISSSAVIWMPKNLEIGNYVAFGEKTEIYNIDKIKIGNKVAISQHSYLCTGTHNYESVENELISKPIIIEDLVWVASGAFIGPGVKLEKGCIVGARAVVFNNCKSFKVYAGNPAKEIKKRAFYAE